MQGTLVNPKLYRSIKNQHGRAVKAFVKDQNKDGSFGEDVKIANVQGLRGMSALCCIALLGQWEFDLLEEEATPEEVPEELAKGIEYLLKCETAPKKLGGPDVFGNCYTIQLMARIIKNRNLARYIGELKVTLVEDENFSLCAVKDGRNAILDYVHNGEIVMVMPKPGLLDNVLGK